MAEDKRSMNLLQQNLTAYESPFLKAPDLKGKPARAIVTFCEIGEMSNFKSGEKENRVLLHFSRYKKPLVLNPTNFRAMLSACGSESDKWIDQEVILTPTKTKQGQDTIVLTVVPREEDDPVGDSRLRASDEDIPF
jgi:hypothetical protein